MLMTKQLTPTQREALQLGAETDNGIVKASPATLRALADKGLVNHLVIHPGRNYGYITEDGITAAEQ